ncbi:hypothetical protein RE628_28860 [Paenibacillus sp. D2_2]|uniref:hypothetical protein n=1 Tax=Paenibacillus sp. D2_2 TaxID=3073092 RepID=UPI002815F1BC|nr:hypothetical protein [Paenibacillus sp. D2_2]WMT41018.1 hypothetical protein RE628_28860 [Paenibacillus sp. D2_2]
MIGWLSSETPDTPAEAVEAAKKWTDGIISWFTNMDMWENFMWASIRIILIFILTRILVHVVYRIIDRTLQRKRRVDCR